ncbi:unnamed protein product [Orchesella dallaii]|uniref:Uncharacterized protein n=1 Tax=Orchesella dallaii TaxID=48710 RepID=A0ABP1Q7P7_9HEXA
MTKRVFEWCLYTVITVYCIPASGARLNPYGKWQVLQELFELESGNNRRPTRIQSKVVFPVPEDVVTSKSYLPDLGFLADLAFLFMPDFPASGLVRLSRDLFESEQCAQYVSCEMTKVSHRHSSLNWIQTFLQDFPFQGDVADRLRQGSLDALEKAKAKQDHTQESSDRQQEEEFCTFSCHPVNSLTRGLKILGLLHDLVRTVKF